MFDYSPKINRVAAQDKDIIAIVNDLFRLAREHLPHIISAFGHAQWQ